MSENDGYGDYATEGDQQLQSGDTLDERGVDDILDEGYSPPEKWSVLEKFGNTAEEEREGESLDQLLAEEEPETTDDGAWTDEDDPRDDDSTTEPRAGRLVAPDEGAHDDEETDTVATDVGVDGGGAAAEEAAVHLTDEPPFS
jgi:hypothetical protein